MHKFVQKACSSVFPLLLYMTCDIKLAMFHLVLEIPSVFMHYQPDKKLKYSPISGHGSDSLAVIVINHGLDHSNKFGSSFLRTIRVRLPSSRIIITTIKLILQFSTRPNCPQIDSQTLGNLHIVASSKNLKQYSM